MSLDPQIRAWMSEAEALLYEQEEMSWRNWVYGEPLDLASTYRGHEHLFRRDTIETVRAEIERDLDPQDRRALIYFANYLTGEYVSRQVAALDDRISNLQAEATVEVDGRHVPFRQLPVLTANETDYDRRGRLSDAAVPVLRQINPILQEKETASRRLARELGYTDYVHLAGELRRADLDALDRLCQQFLDDTDALYARLLPEMTERLVGVRLERFRRADVARMLKLPDFDVFFRRQDLLPTLRRFLSGLGIDLHQQNNLLIHDEELPKKNPRAVCFPLRVPHEIRVSVKPVGGASDYEALLHEMGHAEHYAHTCVPLFPLQQLGNATATESYAFLFEGMVEKDAWLAEFTKMPVSRRAEFRRFRTFIKLFFVRRYCAKLSYELRLHRGEADARELYRKQLERAYGFRLSDSDAERYLSDVDDWFYTADYLRAWFVEAEVDSFMCRTFGETWFASTEAGRLLKSLWWHGNELEGEELLARIGAAGYEPAVLRSVLQVNLEET